MNTKWYRINYGAYCTDPYDRQLPGSWVIYPYENSGSGRRDGWIIAQYVDTESGPDLQFVDWLPTLSKAMEEVDRLLA